MKNKKLLSLLCAVLLLGIVTGCGNNQITQENLNNNTNIEENINQENNVELTYTHKVPGENIFVDVPNWDPMELTYEMMTTVYKVQGSKYVSITDANENVGTLDEAYEATMKVFKSNMYRYHPINSVSLTSQKNETINGIEVYKFEGTMNCKAPNDNSINYDAYIIGYSFIMNGVPCSIIGSVQDVSQEKNMINEIKATVETMIKTVRTER